ncbi:MAG: hypothetical protein EHM23_08710 [Acidobacteria bacterium]|nr:MAG: hypothetical protein EHM23_08710 [Acidobacteriota bacterium]
MSWLLLLCMLFVPQQAQQPPKPKLEAPAVQEPQLPPPGEPQVVAVLSFDGKEFVKAFNATADRARIVMVLAPT